MVFLYITFLLFRSSSTLKEVGILMTGRGNLFLCFEDGLWARQDGEGGETEAKQQATHCCCFLRPKCALHADYLSHAKGSSHINYLTLFIVWQKCRYTNGQVQAGLAAVKRKKIE